MRVDEYDDPAERHVAVVLAGGVPGVIAVRAGEGFTGQ
jgi:hypothetical protein